MNTLSVPTSGAHLGIEKIDQEMIDRVLTRLGRAAGSAARPPLDRSGAAPANGGQGTRFPGIAVPLAAMVIGMLIPVLAFTAFGPGRAIDNAAPFFSAAFSMSGAE